MGYKHIEHLNHPFPPKQRVLAGNSFPKLGSRARIRQGWTGKEQIYQVFTLALNEEEFCQSSRQKLLPRDVFQEV